MSQLVDNKEERAMERLGMIADSNLYIWNGTFGIRVDANMVRIPQELEDFLRACGCRPHDLEEFLDFLNQSPELFAKKFKWTQCELEFAMRELKEKLRGRVDQVFLDPPPPRRYPARALPPGKPSPLPIQKKNSKKRKKKKK